MRILTVLIGTLLAAALFSATNAPAKAAAEEDDPFSAAAFDKALTNSKADDEKNKLTYLPGLFFVSEAAATHTPGDGRYGSDMRFFGKVLLKATKADIGSLFIAGSFEYYLYAAANSTTLRALYQFNSPDPTKLSVDLSEFHYSFDIGKIVFLRVGSQLVSWGAAYFWSPVDFVNRQKQQASVLSIVDVRSGKPGLRIHIPLQPVNIFLFTDVSATVQNGQVRDLAETIAQAWHVDATLFGINFGTTGLVTKNAPVQIGFNATGSLFATDLYGECALSFTNDGSTPVSVTTAVGFSRTFGEEQNWTVRGEFYYNDRGYGMTNVLPLIITGQFTPFYSGKYYAYAELSATKLFNSVFGFSVFGFANIADLSFSLTAQANFTIPNIVPFSVYCRYYGVDAGREFSSYYGGQAWQLGVRVRIEL